MPKLSRSTSQKVVGSVPNGVTGIFHRHTPSGHMALGLTRPLTELSTRYISWGVMVGRVVCIAGNLITFMCRMS